MFAKSVVQSSQLFRATQLHRVASRAFAAQAQTPAQKGTSSINPYSKAAEPRFLENVQMTVENAAAKANIKPEMLNYIMACDNVIRFQIPIKRDNGKLEVLTCYRAQHKHHFMPVKGGTRYAADISL